MLRQNLNKQANTKLVQSILQWACQSTIPRGCRCRTRGQLQSAPAVTRGHPHALPGCPHMSPSPKTSASDRMALHKGSQHTVHAGGRSLSLPTHDHVHVGCRWLIPQAALGKHRFHCHSLPHKLAVQNAHSCPRLCFLDGGYLCQPDTAYMWWLHHPLRSDLSGKAHTLLHQGHCSHRQGTLYTLTRRVGLPCQHCTPHSLHPWSSPQMN